MPRTSPWCRRTRTSRPPAASSPLLRCLQLSNLAANSTGVRSPKYSRARMKTRADSLRALESESFDVCVIGAGATGAGCGLDAQLRGLRTALVDAGDFASGTSSTSTKLAHGGIRYLQQAVAELDPGQFKVVREALGERLLMLQNAP